MKLSASDLEIDIRPGTGDDIPLLLLFMRSMAEFEKLECSATEESLGESLFGENPAAKTLLAFVDEVPAAYAVYFFSFATSVGRRGLWMDDIFVKPEFRGKGIGQALLSYLADLAVRNNCARFEWMVLDWNEQAIGFYRSMGANLLDDWRICRLHGDELDIVAQHLSP